MDEYVDLPEVNTINHSMHQEQFQRKASSGKRKAFSIEGAKKGREWLNTLIYQK
ncbi:MAG TPA: hypothetical protein VFE04_03765 [Puia sp.]|nr:hypothetical protein [Puia sp.]